MHASCCFIKDVVQVLRNRLHLDIAKNSKMNSSVYLIFLLAVLTTSTQGQSATATATPTSNNDLMSNLVFIYIIAAVVLALILIIVILCGVVCVLCQRRASAQRSRRKQPITVTKPSLEHAKTQIEMVQPVVLPRSPMRSKSENSISPGTKSSGSMSDFPLLCRVLQDYSSDHHRTRLNSINSNEQLEISTQSCNDSVFGSPQHLSYGATSVLETSISTNTTTDQPLHDSHDYDELDSVMKDLQSKTGPVQSITPPLGVVPRSTMSSISEAVREDDIIEPYSADELFDDPKYSHLSVSSEYDPSLVRSPPHESPDSVANTTVNGHPTIPIHSMLESASDKVFNKKKFKEYMSLEQVLEIVNTKTVASQDSEEEIPTEADIEKLYSPRVLGPTK